MPTLPNLALDHIEESQDDKEVTANEALDRLDASVNTYLPIALSDANLALSATQEYDSGALEFTGALTANRTITMRASDRKITVFNNTTGGFALVFTTGSGTTFTLRNKGVAEISVDTSANKVIGVGGGNLAGTVDDISCFVIAPENGDITLKVSAARGFIINSLVSQMSNADVTVAFKINGVTVTGLSAVVATVTKTTTTATANNTVVAGDTVTFTISGSGTSPTPIGLALSLQITYTEYTGGPGHPDHRAGAFGLHPADHRSQFRQRRPAAERGWDRRRDEFSRREPRRPCRHRERQRPGRYRAEEIRHRIDPVRRVGGFRIVRRSCRLDARLR
jgi:hypothetical protein